jgi:membrane-bound inhibitor of C-type lysozyme
MSKLKSFALLSVPLALAACSSFHIPNPFDTSTKELSRTPPNSTEYICEGNQHFYLRMLNNGNDAWLIYPDHEVNLPKSEENRYTSGAISLVFNGTEASLNDGEKIAYMGCKPQSKK